MVGNTSSLKRICGGRFVKEVFEEQVNLLVRFRRRSVSLSMSHCDTIGGAEQPVHCHDVIKRLPPRRRVFRTT